jgi:hypothetical protein
VPLQNKSLKGKIQAVLVIASTHLMKEIEDVISPQPCSVYSAGTWYYNEVYIDSPLPLNFDYTIITH